MTCELLVSALLLGAAAGAGPASLAPGIRWEASFDEALKKARQTRRPVLVDFWAEWCSWCHRLNQTTYVDPVVARLSESYVSVKVDTEGGPREKSIADRYQVVSLPTILFLTPQGRVIRRIDGFQGPGQFPRTLEETQEKAQKVMGWERALEKDKNDVEALVGLGAHLHDLEFFSEARELLQRARPRDGDLPRVDRKRVRLLLGIIQHYERRYADADALLREALDLGPDLDSDPKLLYVMGKNYSKWGKLEEARTVLERCLTESPQGHLAMKAREMLYWLERETKSKGKSRR